MRGRKPDVDVDHVDNVYINGVLLAPDDYALVGEVIDILLDLQPEDVVITQSTPTTSHNYWRPMTGMQLMEESIREMLAMQEG